MVDGNFADVFSCVRRGIGSFLKERRGAGERTHFFFACDLSREGKGWPRLRSLTVRRDRNRPQNGTRHHPLRFARIIIDLFKVCLVPYDDDRISLDALLTFE